MNEFSTSPEEHPDPDDIFFGSPEPPSRMERYVQPTAAAVASRLKEREVKSADKMLAASWRSTTPAALTNLPSPPPCESQAERRLAQLKQIQSEYKAKQMMEQPKPLPTEPQPKTSQAQPASGPAQTPLWPTPTVNTNPPTPPPNQLKTSPVDPKPTPVEVQPKNSLVQAASSRMPTPTVNTYPPNQPKANLAHPKPPHCANQPKPSLAQPTSGCNPKPTIIKNLPIEPSGMNTPRNRMPQTTSGRPPTPTIPPPQLPPVMTNDAPTRAPPGGNQPRNPRRSLFEALLDAMTNNNEEQVSKYLDRLRDEDAMRIDKVRKTHFKLVSSPPLTCFSYFRTVSRFCISQRNARRPPSSKRCSSLVSRPSTRT